MNRMLRFTILLALCLLMGLGSGCATFRKMFSRSPQTRTPREKIAEKAEEGRGPKNRSITKSTNTWMDDVVRAKRYDDKPYLSGSDLSDRERQHLESVMKGNNVGEKEIEKIHRRNEKAKEENSEAIWGTTITRMGKGPQSSKDESEGEKPSEEK